MEVMDKPLTARRAQTQERLMAAAVRVFAERGIIGASVEEICETAGFTRGAFYSNFADKDELVLALIRKNVRTQVAAAEQAVARTLSATTRLDTADLVSFVLAAFVEFGTEDRETILIDRELLLYAARQPALRGPYLAFVDECDRPALDPDLGRLGPRRPGVHRAVRGRADPAQGHLGARAADHPVRRGQQVDADAHPADGDHPPRVGLSLASATRPPICTLCMGCRWERGVQILRCPDTPPSPPPRRARAAVEVDRCRR